MDFRLPGSSILQSTYPSSFKLQISTVRTYDIRVLLPGSSFELEPHPQVGQSRSPKKFGRSHSNHPLHPHYSWSEKDVEVASIAAINFSRAFYESYDKPADRLPVRRLASKCMTDLWLILP